MDTEPGYYAEVPTGQVRTPVNPPTRQGELMAAGIVTILIAGVAVSLRLYTRIRVVKTGLNPDDWLVSVAMAMSILMTIFVKKDIDHGLTYHVWDIPQSMYHIGERLYGLLAYLTFILSVSLAKISMLVFYTRLAPQNWVRVTAYSGVFVVVCYSLTAIFIESLGCRPVRGIIDETLSDIDGGCDGSYPGYIAVSCLNIIMDVVILLLPIPIVIPLQIPTRQKILLVLTFATGGFVCAVAIYRVTYIPTLEASQDYDWDAVPDMILCFLEVNAGIVCASVPVLRPFFTRYCPGLISSHGKRSDGGDAGGNGRTINTVERLNVERQELKRRSNQAPQQGSDSLHEMFPVAEDYGSRNQSAIQNDDEEAQLWIRPHESKDSGPVAVTDASSRI